jgi:cell division protein ZapA
MEKTRTIVNICGKEYVMAGYESEEYIHKVAIYVDKKMNELKSQYISLNTSTLAVLTALNIADDMLKLQEQFEALNKEYQELNEEMKKMRMEISSESSRSNVSSINKQGKGTAFEGYK